MLNDFLRYKARHNFILNKFIRRTCKYYELTPQQQENLKNDIFIRQFKHCIKRSKFYKDLYGKHGISEKDIKNLDDLNKLPIISKNDIRERIDDLLIGSKLGIAKGYTSGTSGSPLTIYRNFYSILRENAYHWNFRQKHGLHYQDPKISIRGDLNKDVLYKYDKYANILFISSYNLNEQNFDSITDLIQKFKPKAFLGYPSSLYILANVFQKKNISLEIPLAFTSSETLYDFQRFRIEEIFNLKIYDWYGNSERTIAFEQCKKGKYHEVPLYSINEFHDDHVVTTSLINNVFPLIRYRLDDIIKPNFNETCPCNSKFLMTDKILGRSDDSIRLKDGTMIGSPGVSTSFKEIKGIIYTQIIQNNLNDIDINIVADNNFNKAAEQKLLVNLKARLGEEMNLKINYIDESGLIKSSAGKFKLIINNYLQTRK